MYSNARDNNKKKLFLKLSDRIYIVDISRESVISRTLHHKPNTVKVAEIMSKPSTCPKNRKSKYCKNTYS